MITEFPLTSAFFGTSVNPEFLFDVCVHGEATSNLHSDIAAGDTAPL